MGLARSTYYNEAAGYPIEEARLVEASCSLVIREKALRLDHPEVGNRSTT
jgi:hypothetical protein